jgi:hypothetical protein
MVSFPLLLIPLAICNIIVFLMPSVSLSETLVSVPLTSGADWALTLSDVLVTLGILMLLLEVIKAARPGAKYLTDHLLSLIVFGAALAEFLLWPRFASSTFFLLTLLAMTDFLTGVALRVRRPAAAKSDPRASQRISPEPLQEPAAPQPTAAPPPTHPAPVSEPVPPAHSEPASSEPALVDPETKAATPAPEPAVESAASPAQPSEPSR